MRNFENRISPPDCDDAELVADEVFVDDGFAAADNGPCDADTAVDDDEDIEKEWTASVDKVLMITVRAIHKCGNERKRQRQRQGIERADCE